MKESSRSVTGGRTWLSKGLLVAQVAMSLMLLIGAGLFLRTLYNLRSVDVGFNPNNLLMFRINPQANRYAPVPHSAALHADQGGGRRAARRTVGGPDATALLAGGTSTTSMHIQRKTWTRTAST